MLRLPLWLLLAALAAPLAAAEPTTVERVLAAGAWRTLETPRLVYHYAPGSLAEKELDTIRAKREQVLAFIEHFLEVTERPRFHLFLHPDDDGSDGLPRNGSLPRERAAFVVYRPEAWSFERHCVGHELAHLVCAAFVRDSSRSTLPTLLEEGIAQYLSGGGLDAHHGLTDPLQVLGRDAEFREATNLADLCERMTSDSATRHPFSGAFVAYVVEELPLGRQHLLAILRQWKVEEMGLRRILKLLARRLGVTDESFLAGWKSHLAKYWDHPYPLPPGVEVQLPRLLATAGETAPVKRVFFRGFFQVMEYVVVLEDGHRRRLAEGPGGWKIHDL